MAGEAPRPHPASGGQAHGAAQSPGAQANDQAEDLRRAAASAPGPAARGTETAALTRGPTVAEPQTRKAKPPTHIGKKRSYLGTGRRKTAVARVALTEGSGQITINGRSAETYFTEEKDRQVVFGPLAITDMRNRIDAFVRVNGGGVSGPAECVDHGVARSLRGI